MFVDRILKNVLKLFFSPKINANRSTNNFKKILIVRQHNQFGDLLASTSLFRTLKEKYPQSLITVIVSPDNYYAIEKNKFVNKTFLFDKNKLLNPRYVFNLFKILNKKYDVCIVPVTVSISTTSCILTGFSNAKLKIGPAGLDGVENKYSFLFDEKVAMDWSISPERHVADFGQDILKPLDTKTTNLKPEISFGKDDLLIAEQFVKSAYSNGIENTLIGLHVGAGKVQNRWQPEKFAEVINLLSKKYNAIFYFTGTTSDLMSIKSVNNKTAKTIPVFLNKTVPEVAALISISNLFITNDTGIMHVAGATSVPQISIFGPTNPNNWAPIGDTKYWIKNDNEIKSVSVLEVFKLAEKLLATDSQK